MITQQLHQNLRRLRFRSYGVLGLLVALSCIVVGLAIAPPAAAHWGDLAAAEIALEGTETRIALTYPTGLTAFADDDGSGQLSTAELIRHREALTRELESAIALRDSRNQSPQLTLQPAVDIASANARTAPGSHTTLQLLYSWTEPPSGLAITYTLFPVDAPEASCLATIAQNGQVTNYVFTPEDSSFTVKSASSAALGSKAWFVTLLGAFLWGAVHSLSPGHGKTLVGAYLVGERATPRHALFLALMTTVTHTLGVFALGLITLAAARYVLPEQIYPWLSLISGVMIVCIGANLIVQRRQRAGHQPSAHAHSPGELAHTHAPSTHAHSPSELVHAHAYTNSPAHDHHSHDSPHHAHGHHSHARDHHDHDSVHPPHAQAHGHHHGRHSHSHLPVTPDGTAMSWRSLLLLGLSAGLVPCPAALVLLLGAIAFGNPISGLLLVVAFSLGLASVLAGLGLLLVSAKRMFRQVPAPRLQALQWLPLASAVGITIIGLGISTRSIMQLL
ncbi:MULTISPECIES: sulfite exporter TauE/SafE family protein [Cyanophyceae]|uniref:nickel/cobalt transporter n=1 Tax=Cyanophyceae TaxID=3028117 RepID=UPI001689C7F0|nr:MULTISPECIES: sulfite exporter TauE/SafE family protein [Cyanophyceae]MBD1914374.1 sulfite exporter TauE/SafE family protein [Phormidium sp. FACHB-77]MBD2028642.1 sulfite exporter TauE/SafE family protein [Phormidium sp. FACHB-322]MBD2053664.1 sulfite exporter TauE/SafE family protein [Leptolyngbya sp. FACHB-60]